MIPIWKRRELCVTYDQTKQAQIRQKLSDQNIDYELKTINRNMPTRSIVGQRSSGMGTLGENLSVNVEYVIYVKKEDYELAVQVMNRRA